MSKVKTVRVIVLAGLFIALGIVLRFYAINTPIMRVGLRPVAIMLSSLTLGPVVGAFVAIFEDLLGATLQGWGINPFINAIQLVYGIMPALLLPIALKLTKNRFKLPVYYLVIGLTQFIAGGLLMPAALNLMSGTLSVEGWTTLFVSRIPQQVLHIAVYPPVVYLMAEATQRALIRLPIGRALHGSPLSKHS